MSTYLPNDQPTLQEPSIMYAAVSGALIKGKGAEFRTDFRPTVALFTFTRAFHYVRCSEWWACVLNTDRCRWKEINNDVQN